MATTYHDFESQATDALRLERLRLHITEVRALAASPDTSADGLSVARGNLTQYLKDLDARRKELEVLTGQGVVTQRVSVVRYRGGSTQ